MTVGIAQVQSRSSEKQHRYVECRLCLTLYLEAIVAGVHPRSQQVGKQRPVHPQGLAQQIVVCSNAVVQARRPAEQQQVPPLLAALA